jgi:hypothetical protein
MSRSEVPVSADWVEENLNTPGHRRGRHITDAALLH